jgi:hypothetical protein
VSWPADLLRGLDGVAGLLPLLLAVAWVVRVPLLSREEGHEAITRAAWEGLSLTPEQQEALIRGVRAPDVGLAGILTSALPFAQRRHALRSWSGTTTVAGIREMREFLAATHLRALTVPDGPGRWALFGEALHCLQDSYSPAHVDRAGARIVYMKHWGPLDALRGGPSDEHGFPRDRRDGAWQAGQLTSEARAAVAATRRYLDFAMLERDSFETELAAFLDAHT